MYCRQQNACNKVVTAYDNGNQCVDKIAGHLESTRDALARFEKAAEHNDIEMRMTAICSAEATRIIHDSMNRTHKEQLQAQKDLAQFILTQQQNNCLACPLFQLDLTIPGTQ
jgi:hypothetical protein